MGNSHASSHARQEVARVSAKYRDRFTQAELLYLKRVFDDLARRSPKWVVEPEHFGEYLTFPGLHGTQAFEAFDTKKTGNLDFEEFVAGLARSARGTKEEKIKFLFELYDLKKDGQVSKTELQKMINMVPRDRMHKPQQRVRTSFGVGDHRLSSDDGSNRDSKATDSAGEGDEELSGRLVGAATHRLVEQHELIETLPRPESRTFHEWTNDDLVEEAFEKCDTNKDGRLSFEQFRNWITTTAPQALEVVEEVLEKAVRDVGASRTGAAAAPRKPPAKPELYDRRRTSSTDYNSGESEADLPSMQSALPSNDMLLNLPQHADAAPAYEGFLSKFGHKTSHVAVRYFVLVGNCLYYFVHRSATKPRGLIFLGGCQIERLPDEAATQTKFGFRIVHLDAERLGQRQHTLYANTKKERDDWVRVLCDNLSGKECARHGDFDVKARYELGDELGTGRFAVARRAVDKATGDHVAIKSIEKRQQQEDDVALAKLERDMFRREIAIMRVATHDNVLPLLAVFEDRKHVHLVMPLMKCDLASYMMDRALAGKPTNEEDAGVCFPVILRAVAYLHHLGVAHRDLKPDNILMEDEHDLTRLRLADFSISQILKPDEVMTRAAGSIEYMAPETFLKKGASFPADVWALGVIAFLLVFNRQPFGADTKSISIGYILERQFQFCDPTDDDDDANLKVDVDAAWRTVASDSFRDLVDCKMLRLDPDERITARQALETHPWVTARVKASDDDDERHPLDDDDA